jgi:hypothetical protein
MALETLLLLACGGAVGGCGYLLLAPRGFSPAARRTTRWWARLQRLRASAARWATGAEPLALEVAGVSPARLVATRLVLALMPTVALALLRLWWLLPLAVPLLSLLPVRSVNARLAAWRRALRLDLADAVDYVQLHFDTGATVPDALDGAAAFLSGPLGAELRRVNAHATLFGPEAALAEFARRLGDPDADSLARRLLSAWSRHAPGPDTFAGMTEALRRLRAAQIRARTRTLPIVYTLLIGWLLFAVAALAAPPALLSLLRGLGGVL